MYPVWLWPHLLSLDAPLVAIVWQLLLSRTITPIPRVQTIVLGLSVWLIYITDRVLDGFRPPTANDPPRHRFARSFKAPLIVLAVAALIADATLAFGYLEPIRLERGTAVLALVAAHFFLTHRESRPWPKELWIGLVFATGVWLPALVASPRQFPEAILFAALCWWNCVAIEVWEQSPERQSRWHRSTRWLATHLRAAAITLVLAAAVLWLLTRQPATAAETFSAAAFWVLHRQSSGLSKDTLRFLVDIALLTPVLF